MPSKNAISFPLGGVSQGLRTTAGAAADISNARMDDQGGWVFDRGLAPWYDISKGLTSFSSSLNEFQEYIEGTVDSLFVWTKRSGESYVLFEQNGTLQYYWGNKNQNNWTIDRVVLDTDRHIPAVSEAGTQYVPFGNRLLILNGVDKPLWFYGDEYARDFGFLIETPGVDVLPVDHNYRALGTGAGLEGGTAAPYFQSNNVGLGDRDENDMNSFGYAMTFVTDSGAESPLSAESYVSWVMGGDAAEQRRYGVFLSDLPTGPEGVVARKLYRTRNMRLPENSNSNDTVYYLVRQINENFSESFIDITPDQRLVTPHLSGGSVTIDTGYITGANWSNRMWLAGGATHPTRIIYSRAGLPEQFARANYIDVGNTEGGRITKLFAYYNNLLVFRESSIDVIRTNGSAFAHSQVDSSVGTTAVNTIATVPDLGVLFLTQDGLYGLAGGLDGGSQIRVEKVSKKLGDEEKRISEAAIAKASAAYSTREKEYWVHYPERGSTIPTRGIVFHSKTGDFSFRHAPQRAQDFAWKFTAMGVLPSGHFVLGTKPNWSLGDSTTTGSVGHLAGLQVWCGSGNVGQVLTSTGLTGQDYGWNIGESTRPENYWQSTWIHFGDTKARVFHVEIEMVAYGDNDIELEWGYEYESTWNSAGTQSPIKGETAKTSSADPVLGPADLSVTKRPFIVGTDAAKTGRLIRVRWDVNTGLSEAFRFRIKSEHTMHILNARMTASAEPVKTLNQRARNSYGQPR